MKNTVERSYILAQLYSTHFGWPLKPIYAYESEMVASSVLIKHCEQASNCHISSRAHFSHITMGSSEERERTISYTVNSARKDNRLYIGQDVSMQGVKFSFNKGNQNLVIIDDGVNLNQLSISFKGDNNLLYIGPMTSFGSGNISVGENNQMVIIGAECMISSRVMLDTTDSHSIYDIISGQRVNQSRSVVVSPKVWLGRDVRVNKGAFIGRETVVGQGSLVSGCLKSNSVYAGCPARQLKSDVTWSRMPSQSLAEMEQSQRHKRYLERKNVLLSKCFENHFQRSPKSFNDRLSKQVYIGR
ncbi:acyltransferase [Vibrio nereis]|uniref:acyltransferase n=1 Tax=Vibrio nereis TaxID=693 RepID=UPI0024946360|nr:hypothetical protein [Vibrio nereis]